MNWKQGVAALFFLASTLIPLAAEGEQIGLTAEQIDAFPKLTLTPLTPNEDLMFDRRYMKLAGGANVYDAPNGNHIRTIDPGFVFVTTLGEENGWTRINRTEWVTSDMISPLSNAISPFTGIPLPAEPLPHPIGWALVDTYLSSEPGIWADKNTEGARLVKKYDPLNFYSSVILKDEESGEDRVWYQVGTDEWIHQYNVSKFEALTTLPEGVDTEIWFAIDLYEQNITLYRGTTPVFVTLTGTGLPRWPTYEGVFHIYYRTERENMSWGAVGDDYYLLEEVPWTMYFDEGRALHGAYWHNSLGYRRSHGCVNMSITDAHYMYQQVADFLGEDATSTTDGPAVFVFSSGTYSNHR